MNGLTLRISSDKKTKPLKKEIEKEDLQSLLSSFVPGYEKTNVFEELLKAETVELQVQALKEIFGVVYSGKLEKTESLLVIDVLTYVFLKLKQKSPLLQSLIKFLTSAPQNFECNINECITKNLSVMLLEADYNTESIVDISFTLLVCLDNAKLSKFELSRKNLVSEYLETSLTTCHDQLLIEKTPIKKLQLISGIHSCIQAGISLTQKYPEITLGRDIFRTIFDILCNPELPLDTRAASGIFVALVAADCENNYFIDVYSFVYDKSDDLGMILYVSGLLTVLPLQTLSLKIFSYCALMKPVLYTLFRSIFDREERRASDSVIVLAATRGIVQATRCFKRLPSLLTPDILDLLLPYLWSHIDHYMDAVRHLALGALSIVASIGAAHPELGVFEAILEHITVMSVEERSKHAAISELVTHVPVERILLRNPSLPKALFSALSNSSSNYALNSLEALIRQDFIERTDRMVWFQLWLKPLLLSKLTTSLEQILTAVIRKHPPVLEHITSLGLDINKENIDVVLTCLKIGRKYNLLSGKDNINTWKGLVNYNVLESCMYHSKDDVRLACLSLLVETSKSTEEFTPYELNLLRIFFAYNSSTQDPAVRQRILASCKKLLTRLGNSQSSLQRRQQKYARSETTSENLTIVLDEYQKFLNDFTNNCLESLFPGSSPSRRTFALGVLAIMKHLGLYEHYDQRSAEILFSCLLDSYEDNKIIARDLLSSYPLSLLNLQDQEHVENYVKNTLILSSSIRPPDSISAGYYMSLLASFDGITNEKDLPRSTCYFCLTTTLSALKDELQVAKESLLQAASSGPLYGHLFVIRHLLQGVDLKEVGTHSMWCTLLEEIIEIAFECNNVVACIVYNSSPEGHIPMDFSYSELKKEDDPQVTSQMVLLCSWRTVKEVSLLLGELSERATIKENDNDCGLLTEDQILAIGDHLMGLLYETKHRGAFEQAYLGFSKLTGRLWKCYAGKLHELPKRWLNETLECIMVNQNLSATRRSAGIPFIVQGLICSELESGSCKSLHQAMSSLLKIAKEGCSEGKLHALNILRALYRGSSLGEAVGPYVADGIAAAINGFNSDNWAEKNSATLLLSALMSRVFGVPRGKSEVLSWRNRMTGRLFFQRYPTLYTEILSHLEASSSNHMYPALYPVLLLLGRLYPSSLEGTDSNLQLLEYIPFVMACSKSSVMKTRELAAIAFASLRSTSYECEINELMDNISITTSENHLHGYLLMVLKLIQKSFTLEDVNIEMIKLFTNRWTENLILILNTPKHSFIVKDTCIQVIIYFVVNYYKEIFSSRITSIKSTLDSILFTNESGKRYGYEVVLVHSAILLFLLNFQGKFIDELNDVIIRLLQSDEYDVVAVTLEFLEFIASNSSSTFCPNIYNSLKLELNDVSSRIEFSESFKKSKAIGKILADKILSNCNHHEDLVKLLKCYQFFPIAFKELSHKVKVIEFFCNLAEDRHRSVASYAISNLNRFLCLEDNKNNLENNDIEYIANLINTYSQPEEDHQCRQAVTELLSNNFGVLVNNSSKEFQLTFWLSAVRLVLDESQDIRNMASIGLVGRVIPSRALELLLQRFVDETSETVVVFICLLYWAVGEPLFVDNIEEGAVFDKGNINLNYEDLILNRLACKHMKSLVKDDLQSILNTDIDSNLQKWVTTRTKLKGRNIAELIDNYKMSVVDCSDIDLLIPYRPFDNQRLLEKYKLNNILEALNFVI